MSSGPTLFADTIGTKIDIMFYYGKVTKTQERGVPFPSR